MRAIRMFALQLTLVALATLVLPAAAGAQTGLASITGIVSDESGGAVPGLTVTATNQATNIGYTGVTNEAGNYIITSVPIGTYVIATELQGFKSVQSTVTLSAAQTARVDFKLELGVSKSGSKSSRRRRLLQTRERSRWQRSSSASRSRRFRSRDGICRRSRSTPRARFPLSRTSSTPSGAAAGPR